MAGLGGLKPAGGTDTPTVARLQPDKPVFGPRCRQIVPDRRREGKELGGHRGTDRVRTEIFR